MKHIYQALATAQQQELVARTAYEYAQALAENAAMNRANGDMGKNAEDRKRNLTLAIRHDAGYTLAETTWLTAKQDVLYWQGELETYLAERREWEIRMRGELITVLRVRYAVSTDVDADDTIADTTLGYVAEHDAPIGYDGEDFPF